MTGSAIDGIEPCPDCGSTTINRSGNTKNDLWFAWCYKCGYRTRQIKTYKKLIETWNEIPRNE